MRPFMRRLGTFALLVALACIAHPAAHAEAADFPSAIPAARKANPGAAALLIVHYRRAGGDYDGWNLWTWPSGGEGGAFAFSGTDAFGRYAVVPFAQRPDGAGFLVRRGNWEAKDVDGDRGVSFASGPVQEVWLVSGDATVHRDPSAIDLKPRVRGAFLDASDRVTLATTQPLSPMQRKGVALALRGDVKSAPRCARVDGPGEGGVYTIKLAGKVKEADVAALELRIPELNPAPVFARGVLDQPSFTPLDAKLGAICTPASTTFTTWSPVAESVDLLLFGSDLKSPPRVVPLTRGARGLWSARVDGDLHGTRYRYRFRSYGKDREVPDIHCVAATNDSAYSVVADLAREEPADWNRTPVPTLASPTDEVIYEIHVRDYSIADPACPPELRGTYLGIAQPGARAASRSGVAHLKDLGVTAVHLLPIHDFTARPDEYNWGYWTALFNVPESNYASRKGDPLQPVRELRTTIQALHAAGIRVILDVVYNHTSSTGESSPFDQTVPFYFHRTAPDGSLLNDAGVGNCMADERPMMRKYILDSLEHWTRDYRVDGFRFDLVGTHTPETVKAVCERLLPIRGDLTLYGEPWTGGGPIRFGKGAQKGLRFAVFNDHIRNAIRGDLDGTATGFATGPGGDRAAVQRGVRGAIDDFAQEPLESVAYVSAHDNLTLWDKLVKSQPQASDATRRAMQKLALGMVLTSQGIAFLHGGCDFARTKGGNHNSYNAGDEVNRFDWQRKGAYADVHDYVRGLVALRRAHPAFRMDDDEKVRRAVRFLDGGGPVAFTIDGSVATDPWNMILVAYNGEATPATLSLPAGSWQVVVDAKTAGTETVRTVSGEVRLPPWSMLVARRP
jgi:pullulanase